MVFLNKFKIWILKDIGKDVLKGMLNFRCIELNLSRGSFKSLALNLCN